MINNVVLMGRLTSDPELRTTTTGISVCSFTIAVNRSYAKQGEERQTDFIDVVAWRQSAEFVSRYFHKGSMIIVQGAIQTRNYEDKNGNKRKAVEVIASNVSFGESKRSDAPPAANPFDAEPIAASYSSGSISDFEEITGDEDLPF